MGDTRLSFKIKADLDNADAVKASKELKKQLLDAMGQKKKDDPFQQASEGLKGYTKQFEKLNKSQNKLNNSLTGVSKASEDIADVLKNVNREDLAIANKLAQKGKEMQMSGKNKKPDTSLLKGGGLSVGKQLVEQSAQQSKKLISDVSKYQAIQKPQMGQMMQGTQEQQVSMLKASQLNVENMKVNNSTFEKAGGLGAGGISGKSDFKQTTDTLRTKIDDAISSGLKAMGAGMGIPLAGALVAGAGIGYQVMSAKAGAFRQQAQQQIQPLTQLGFGAGEGGVDGFYRGTEGTGPGGQQYFLTGQQQSRAMVEFARQTGSKKRGQIEDAITGGRLPLAAVGQAYGLDIAQMAGTAGTMQRFGAKGEKGTDQLIRSMGMAERVGMGGARQQEFIDAMQEAMTAGVQEGMQTSNAGLMQGLGTLMSTNDERLKAIAPEIMRSSTQVMGQAATLRGGAESNLAFQAIMNQMQETKPGATIFDVQEQLADQSKWLENMQAILRESSKRAGGQEDFTALYFTRAIGKEIASPELRKELVNLIRSGAPDLSMADFEKEVAKRMESTSQMVGKTLKQDVIENLHSLSKANSDAADGVNALRETITKFTDSVYEDGIKKLENLSKMMDKSKKASQGYDMSNPQVMMYEYNAEFM